MHAVVGRSTVHDKEKGRAFLKEHVIPRVSQAPGFVGAFWVALDDNTGASILAFETEEGAKAAAEQIKSNPPPGDAVTINTIQLGEVVGRA
jgi:hypothetical protein